MASSTVAADSKKQMQSAIAEIKRILSKHVNVLIDEIEDLGAPSELVRELRYVINDDTNDVLEDIVNNVQHKKYIIFDIIPKETRYVPTQ